MCMHHHPPTHPPEFGDGFSAAAPGAEPAKAALGTKSFGIAKYGAAVSNATTAAATAARR